MRSSTNRGWRRLAAMFAVAMLVLAACGGTEDDTTTAEAADTTVTAPAEVGLRVAIVAPSAKDDLAFSQSMVDSVDALDRTIDLAITDGTFVVEEAAAAIRGYAEDGYDLVIVHGTQFGGSLAEIAPDFPAVSFAWGTASDTLGQPNVFAYTPAANEGGYVLGTVAASLSENGVIGVVGPVEAGDAVLYVNGFAAGAEASGDVEVNITYTGSFGDVALAKEAAEAHLTNDVDVLTGSAQMVVGAIGVAVSNGVPWFGTQANQTELGPDIVVASQVYHWEGILEEMLVLIEGGTLGGQAFEINLANGGLVLEFNDGFELPDGVKEAAEATVAGIIDGSIVTDG